MKETRTEHPCSDVWGSQCPKLAFCPKLSDRRTRSTSADFEPAALLSSSRHLILSRLVPDLPPSPPACSPCNFHHPPRPTAWPKSGSVAFCFVCSATWIFLRHRRSTACYCWTPQTAHCCGRGGGTGRLLTNSWRPSRFGLFSTQHSSRTHLAHPLLLFTKNRWICHQHFQCHPGMTVSIASLSESLWGQISPACMNRMFLTFPESTAPCCQQTIVLISWAIAMNLYSSDKGVLMWKRAYFCSQKQSLS